MAVAHCRHYLQADPSAPGPRSMFVVSGRNCCQVASVPQAARTLPQGHVAVVARPRPQLLLATVPSDSSPAIIPSMYEAGKGYYYIDSQCKPDSPFRVRANDTMAEIGSLPVLPPRAGVICYGHCDSDSDQALQSLPQYRHAGLRLSATYQCRAPDTGGRAAVQLLLCEDRAVTTQ